MFHKIESIRFDRDTLLIDADNRAFICNLKKHSKKLLNATDEERANYKISPSGYGIHWPSIDEDLSVDGLLGISHQSSFEDVSLVSKKQLQD